MHIHVCLLVDLNQVEKVRGEQTIDGVGLGQTPVGCYDNPLAKQVGEPQMCGRLVDRRVCAVEVAFGHQPRVLVVARIEYLFTQKNNSIFESVPMILTINNYKTESSNKL